VEFISRIEIDGVRGLGDVTVADVRLRGHGGESDARVEQEQWHVARWRHEKIIWWHVFLSEAEALEAAEQRA
jgi:hypothetical protein